MVKALASAVLVLWALAGCSALSQPQNSASSACAREPGGYDCQIERYQRAD